MNVTSLQSTSVRVTASLVLVTALAMNWLPNLDEAASQYLDDAITDNLIIYATARSINGIISVIQSIELSFSLGAGVGINLGEILDPLNDLIERFSGFVLYGLAGLGMQKIVLTMTSSLAMKVLVSVLLVAGLLMVWVEQLFQTWIIKLAALLLLVRFCFVVEVGTIAILDAAYFDQQKAEAHSALDVARNRLSSLRQQYMQAVEDRGLFSGMWQTAGQIMGDENQDGVTDLAASAIVELIVIMLIRGLLLPLLFVWGVIVLARQLARM